MSAREVTLLGGSPWGFRMHGGCDSHQPLRISRVNPGSKAAQRGIREGDLISSINGRSTRDLTNSEAHALLRNSGEQLKLGLNQENIGSPKRRIYKSSLQQNTITEIQNKNTTTTTTTRTRTEKEQNAANDTKADQSFHANQNGALRSCSSEQPSDVKKDQETFVRERFCTDPRRRRRQRVFPDYASDAEDIEMPQGNARNRSRKNRNRRRAQQLAAVAESSRNDERRKHEREAFDSAACSKSVRSNDDGANDYVSIDPIRGDDRDESRHRGHEFRPDDKRSIEKIEVKSRPRTVEITTFSSLPLEATIGHIAGVGILETGIRDRAVTVSEPVESPFPEHSRIAKRRSFEADGEGDPWARGDRLEIREVSDSDAEADPTTIEVDSERNSPGGSDVREESEPSDQIRRQIVPRERPSETESLTLKWDTVAPRMMERKFPRKRNSLESAQLPSFFEKGPEEKGSCETFTEKIEEDEPVERMAVLLRRKMRRRAISELHYPSSFLNIIQEEGDRLSEDEAQHIRDFINEEISKYRRESKHSAERTMEGEAEEDDTCGYIATVCENDVSANIDTVENDICVELHPSDAANNSGVFATAVGSAEDIEAEVIQDADSAIKATDNVSFNEPIDVVSSGMQSNSNRIENRTAKGILQRGENEERLASRKPKNNARIDDTPPLYDTNDTNEAQDNELLRKIETIEKSENRKDHNSSFDLQCALHNEATSSRTKQSLPPPLPPKRSSSFGHGLRRLPTSIETEASSSSSVRRLLPTNDGPTNISMRADCKTEKLESSRRPELRECGGPSASRIDRAVYEVDSSDSCEFSPSSSSTVELDDCEGERAGTASKAGYVEPASARVDPSIALSGICDDNPHGVATGAEVTRNCEEGRPAAPAVPSASSNRQGNETEARANRNDLVKGSFEAGSSNARSPDESSTSDKSYTRPNCSTKDGLETHRRPSDSNDAGKPGREEEESTFSLHHERTVKSETLETRIIERREETTSIDQRTNCCDSNDSSRGLKREERHENPFDFLGSQTAVDIPSVNVNSPPAEVIDPQGPDSSSSTASLSTVRHRPLETSLTDISAIVQEAKDDSFNDEPDESLKWKLTLLKNGESTDTASGECPGSPQPIPYSPVEDLYYVPLNIDFAVEVPEKTSKNALYRIQQRSPSPLRELCVKKILSMPFGSQIISEITTSKLNIFEGLRSLQWFVSNVPSARRDNVRLNPHGVNEPTPSDMAGLTKTSSAHESPRPNDFENAVSDYYVKMPEGEVNIETRLSNAEGELERGNWKCLSTSKDPRLLVCLSPSQQATSVRTSADALLDLHQKFLKRYSYRDEQPHRAPLLQYRVQVCPTTKEDDDDDDDDANGASTRCNAAVGISSNRLLEIIKEHSPSDPDLQNGTLADRQPEMVNDSSNSSYAFERKEHPDAARPDDRTSRANRRDRAAVNELFLAAARSEDDKPGHAIPGYQSRIAPRPIVEVKYRRSNDNTMIRDPGKLDVSAESFAESSTASNSAAVDRSSCDVAAKRAAPWRTTDFGRHVNPALIDDKLEVPPLPKRAVTVDRSCIDVTSIFDQSPLVLPKERETTEEVIKRMATAEIMDQLRRLQTETSQRLDGSRRSSLPQGCFAQQLRYIEALEEQLKNAILAEEEEQRKAFEELQMHVRRTKQHDDAKTLSPAGTHEEDAWWEINATPECECETRIDDRNRIAGGKRAGNKQDERQGSVGHLGRAYRIDSEIRMESRQGRSSNSGNDYRQGTGIIDGTHDRQFSNEISLERGVYEEELPGNIEDRECRAASEKGNVGALENGASKFHEKAPGARRVVRRTNEITKMLEGGRSIGKTMRGNVYNDVKSQRDTTLPTNGEAFRQRMYDEYMRKMLERQERKNHKVVKISSHETSTCRKMSGKSDDMSAIAKEFIEKARSRLCKSDHDESETDHEEYRDDSDGTISAKCLIDGEELEDIRKLPKHLREFLKISAIINDEGGRSCNIAAKGRDNESDLLHEIDKALRVSRGFLLEQENAIFAPIFKASSAKPGVWSPGQTLLAEEPSPERTKEPQRDGAIPPVWIPVNAGASPIAERKEFRPVPFESPVLSRRKQPKEEENTPPWENEGEKRGNFEESRGIYESSTSRIVNSHSAPSQGLNTLTSTPRLPRAQNPTITLLQKAREGQLPKGAAYLERSEFADNRSPTDEKPLISPGEIIYIAKKEYEPETENEPPKRMADSGARKFEGIGPVTKEGIPLVLRSEVKESNQAKWYKRMYQSLHRADRHDDYVTVRYKQKRGGRYGYGSSSGYLSEPEPRAYSDRSVTVDSRRRLRNKENDFTTATMPRRNGALRYSTEIYKNQPGRIEDYEPGHSSIAEKEAKEWWDEVMDIFDGWLNENGRPQHAQIRMESLRGVRQSYVLSPSQRLEDSHSVRIPAISSTKNSEVDARPRPLIPESSTDRSTSDRPMLDRGRRPSSRSCLHRSISRTQSKPSVADATDRSNEQNVDKDTCRGGGRITRTLERADQSCYWHATGMLEGRSKSFVLLDRCPGRLQPVSIERPTDCNVAAGQSVPLPVAVVAPGSAGGNIQHRYHRNHHHEYHQHCHHCRQIQEQEPQQRPSLSSSSTSSSFSSIDYVMLPTSPTTPSTQASSSRPFDQRNARTVKPYTLPHGLKESGYESDSTLVFRRREDVSPLSLLEQRLAYKTVQSGGDVPLHGLRKPAPERPKDDSEIEYFPISPSLTRIRVHRKIASKTLTVSSSLKTTHARHEHSALFSIDSRSLIMKASRTAAERFSSSGSAHSSRITSSQVMPRPPSPPRRKSSRHSKTLKLYSETRVGDNNPHSSKFRHEQCLAVDSLFSIKPLRERSSSNLERYRRNREQCYNTSNPISSKTAKVPSLFSDTFGKRRSDPCLPQSQLEASTEKRLDLIPSGVRRHVGPPLSPGLRSTRQLAEAKIDGKYPIEDKLLKYTSVIKEGQRSPEKRQTTVRLQPSAGTRKNKLRSTKKEQKQPCGKLNRLQAELSAPMEIGRSLRKDKEARDTQNKMLPLGTVAKSSYSSAASKQKRPADKSVKVLATVSPKEKGLLRKTPEQSTVTKKTSSSQFKPFAKSTSAHVAAKTIVAESKKTEIIAKPQERLNISKESSHSESSSCSKIRDNVNERKRLRQKPHTIAGTPMKKPEKICVDVNSNRKKIEIKRKMRRDKNGDDASKSLGDWKEAAEKEDTRLQGETERRESRKPLKGQIASLTTEKVKRYQEATRVDASFQNHFRTSRSPAWQLHTTMKRSFVGERTKTFQDMAKENFKSEPSLKSFSVYLTQKRPVSNSRFKNWERESVSSRDTSPYRICSPGRSVFQKVTKFDSLLGIEEFGSSTTLRDRDSELSWQCAKERSLSEPPLKTLAESRESSPRFSTSSLSRPRRISASRQDDLGSLLTSKQSRARSAGEAEDAKRYGSNFSLTKSACSLSSFDREGYQQYILELLHYKRKSKRYKDLLDFYANLSRIDQLEHRFSSGELRSRMKNEEIIDYDRWKQVRSKEKAEKELETLYGKLQTIQRDKNFLFTVKDVNKLRWRGDSRLRCKERSVEDILQYFKRLQTEESELQSSRRRAIYSQKDVYKPLWRGSSVVNVAATMQRKAATTHDADGFADHPYLQRSLGGSKKFWSSLSIEQVATLKKQLNEIYGSDGPQRPVLRSNGEVADVSREISEDRRPVKESRHVNERESLSNYEIVVPPEGDHNDRPQDDFKGLHVRCHSMIATNESATSTEERNPDPIRVERSILKKSDSIGRLERSESDRSKASMLMSELEKKKLSLSLSKEIMNKMTQRRLSVPLVPPRETRGSIAVAKASARPPAKSVKQPSCVSSVASVSPRTCYSFEAPYIDDSAKCKDKNYLLVLVPNNENAIDEQRAKTVLEEWSMKPPLLTIAMPEGGSATKVDRSSALGNDTDNTTESSEASVRTVIQRGVEAEHVSRKIEFFENAERREEHRHKVAAMCRGWKGLSSSQSFADLKELFGERKSAEYGPFGVASNIDRLRSTSLKGSTVGGQGDDRSQMLLDGSGDTRQRSLRPCSREQSVHDRSASVSPCRAIARSNSSSSLESGWLRSSSPDPARYWRAYLKLVRNGMVRRLRSKFESVEDLPRRSKFVPTPKRFRSDPELTRSLLRRTIAEGHGDLTLHEYADVACLRKRFETRRGRSPPIPRVSLRRENLSMPRIDIISKTAELKKPNVTSTVTNHAARQTEARELEAIRPVRRMRNKFESLNARGQTSVMGEMFTSAPDVRELRNIAPYLAGQWVAHRYPSRRDNMRSLSSPADLELYQGTSTTDSSARSERRSERARATSSSPTRPRGSIFKPSRTIFAGQAFDPDKHRPRFRYQPPPPSVSPIAEPNHRTWWSNLPVYVARPIVTFEEYSNAPPPPPKSQHCRNDRQESPRRYVDGEVTIHYRSPVRTETKELLSEEELARRSAENMRRVYQEERRRKYLQELHDIDSRRHTDNFTPSQKSPIPLNRYDDFVDDLSRRSRSQDQTPEPRLVARALYNFVGQSSRELTFRRGDIIFVRRQVDKNWYEGEYNAMIGLFPFNYVEILPYDGMRTTPKKAHEGQARAKFNFVAQTNLELSLAKGELVVLTRRVDENWYEGRIGNRTGIFPASYVEVVTEPGHRSGYEQALVSETTVQNKPVASPAAHSLLANSSSGGKMSMGPHHYVPSIPVNINTIQPSYNSLPRMGGSKLHVSQLSETLHIDTHSEPIPYRALYNYKPQNDDELELKEGDTVYVMEKCDDGWYVGSSQRTGYFGTFPGNYVDRL